MAAFRRMRMASAKPSVPCSDSSSNTESVVVCWGCWATGESSFGKCEKFPVRIAPWPITQPLAQRIYRRDDALLFFIRAINKYDPPEKITLDGYAATHTAVRELKEAIVLPVNVCVRTSKYLNNLIEQDHRRVKQRVYLMLGFKKFNNAVVTISGIELAHKIRKKQFDTSMVEQNGARAQQIWEAVLAA
jgi:hypothetical protein